MWYSAGYIYSVVPDPRSIYAQHLTRIGLQYSDWRNNTQRNKSATCKVHCCQKEVPCTVDRRRALGALAIVLACGPASSALAVQQGSGGGPADVGALQAEASKAYARQDFATAVARLNDIIDCSPADAKYIEMRAQALVDGKNFASAIQDFNYALSLVPKEALVDRARLLSGRGLAYEGLGDWVSALQDYDGALKLAQAGGQLADPYVLCSRGNCHASLGEWARAREDYLASAEGFQRAAGYRVGRSTTPRLDGAVFAASNAALMLAELGEERAAVREMQAVARRAPGSVDMRAALAAIYWRQGQEAAAESEWEFACTQISVGCSKYQDPDWLLRIRRWPPSMVTALQDFLSLRSSRGTASTTPAAAFKE